MAKLNWAYNYYCVINYQVILINYTYIRVQTNIPDKLTSLDQL